MASFVHPQALFMVPQIPTRCAPKMLAFSASVSSRASVSASRRTLTGFEAGFRRVPLVVRAEADSEGVPESTESVEEAVESEAPEVELEAQVATEERSPWKPRTKLGDVMGILNKRAIEASDDKRPTPDIRTGDVVEIKLEVPENRKRLSVYKGIVISKQNAGIHTTIRIRRIIAGIGVEIVFPVYSPNIKEIRVVSHRKVRRARLYYLRDKLPRLSTFK